MIRERAPGLITALFEEAGAAEDEAWDMVAKEFGYESFADAWKDGGKLVRCDYITGEIILLRLKKDETE